jgi:FkbM family methyltransferase
MTEALDTGPPVGVRPAPFKARAVRAFAAVLRLRSLPLARWAFAGVGSPFLVQRPLFGRRFVLDASRTDTHRLLYVDGERFLTERTLVRELASGCRNLVEVGANIGYFTLLYAACADPAAGIVCLEPEPDNLEELRRNVRVNDLRNVRVLPVAASDEDRTVTLRAGINGVVGQGGDLLVEAVRLDSVVDGPVDYLKIDVEGHEVHVLKGAEALLGRHHPNVIVEVHPGLIHPPYDVADALAVLRAHYPAVGAVTHRLRSGPLRRLEGRYVASAALDTFPDAAEVVDRCRSGLQTDPFWLVCRRG